MSQLSQLFQLFQLAKPAQDAKQLGQLFYNVEIHDLPFRGVTCMVIYGTALLSLCLLVGLVAGQLLGLVIGVDKNVGGVGIAMLVLILACERLQRAGMLPVPTQQGVLFWSSIYIPIVVAMSASQNVLKAIASGPLALAAGGLSVVACFALVPLISRLGDATQRDAGGP